MMMMDPKRGAHNNNNNNNSHHQHLHHASSAAVAYRECLKNHAATLGAHATDGCGEFIASPSSDHSDPTSLTCAACGCHRNFHRRVEIDSNNNSGLQEDDGEAAVVSHHDEDDEAGSHVLLTLKTGGVPASAAAVGPTAAAEAAAGVGSGGGGGGGGKRKRFRSRFSREQKEGMMELAERLGWRLQRRDEDVVEDGCRRIGIERGVFKVWMHNNKQAVLEMKNKNKISSNVNNISKVNDMVINGGDHGERADSKSGINCSSSSL